MLAKGREYISSNTQYISFEIPKCKSSAFWVESHKTENGIKVNVQSNIPGIDDFDFFMQHYDSNEIKNKIEEYLRSKYNIISMKCIFPPWMNFLFNLPSEILRFLYVPSKSHDIILVETTERKQVIYKDKIFDHNAFSRLLQNIQTRININGSQITLGPETNIVFDRIMFFKEYFPDDEVKPNTCTTTKKGVKIFFMNSMLDFIFTGIEYNGRVYGEIASIYGLFFVYDIPYESLFCSFEKIIIENTGNIVPIKVFSSRVCGKVKTIKESGRDKIEYCIDNNGSIILFSDISRMNREHINIFNEFFVV